MRILLILSLFITFNSNASDHSDGNDVLAAHAKYYAARTDRDFKTMVAMESESGVYETYSDGSFHKPGRTWSLADYESNFPIGTSNVYFSEAVKITDDAYYVRFYYEGVNGENNAPYRTRVTETWVKEKGKWVRKTSHFSSAAYGGVHQTSKSYFEE